MACMSCTGMQGLRNSSIIQNDRNDRNSERPCSTITWFSRVSSIHRHQSRSTGAGRSTHPHPSDPPVDASVIPSDPARTPGDMTWGVRLCAHRTANCDRYRSATRYSLDRPTAPRCCLLHVLYVVVARDLLACYWHRLYRLLCSRLAASFVTRHR